MYPNMTMKYTNYNNNNKKNKTTTTTNEKPTKN